MGLTGEGQTMMHEKKYCLEFIKFHSPTISKMLFFNLQDYRAKQISHYTSENKRTLTTKIHLFNVLLKSSRHAFVWEGSSTNDHLSRSYAIYKSTGEERMTTYTISSPTIVRLMIKHLKLNGALEPTMTIPCCKNKA